MSRTLLPLALLAPFATPAAAQSVVETFDNSSNIGGWSGNPGAHFAEDCLDTFAVMLRTTDPASPFGGDWRARDVRHFGVDLVTNHVQFPFEREVSIILTDGNVSVFHMTGQLVPQIAEGWRAIDVAIDVQPATLPAEWQILVGSGDDDADWNAIVQNVQEVTVFYGNPQDFFIFDQWFVGCDNPRITEGGIGTNYCVAVANSTGVPASIAATGSDVVTDGVLYLMATDLPLNQFGYFLASETQGFVANPGGSQGNLCLGGAIARYAKQAASSGAIGQITLGIDLGAIPTTPPSAVQPGETWNFQLWYRDKNPTTTSNFTDGVAVTFQ